MLPFGIGIPEVLMILIVVLLVVGPSKLPELARTLAKGVRAARRAGEEIRNAIDIDELDQPPHRSWETAHHIEDAQEYPHEEDECEMDDGEHEDDGRPRPQAREPATASPAFYEVAETPGEAEMTPPDGLASTSPGTDGPANVDAPTSSEEVSRNGAEFRGPGR